MSKEVINELKDKARERRYADLQSTESSDYRTYKDLDMDFNSEYEFVCDLVINGKAITNDLIKNLYLKYENLITEDKDKKGSYRLFLKQIFTEHAGAAVPNDSIMEELITHYNRLGYKKFFSFRNQTFHPFGLRVYSSYFSNPSYREMTCMSCEDSNCLKFSFSVVEFKLKCEV
ncbi:UNVERIFIED_CONTAM: hypothetical protein LBW93_01505 [Wolbachia endosymbiont of Nasonia longicornis]